MASLVVTLRALKDYRALRALFEDVHSRRRRTLGDDHPHTIGAAAKLAETLHAQEDYPALQALLEDVLSRRRRSLGDERRHTVSTRKGLDDMSTDS